MMTWAAITCEPGDDGRQVLAADQAAALGALPAGQVVTGRAADGAREAGPLPAVRAVRSPGVLADLLQAARLRDCRGGHCDAPSTASSDRTPASASGPKP